MADDLTEAEIDAWEAEANSHSPIYVASVDVLKLIAAAREGWAARKRKQECREWSNPHTAAEHWCVTHDKPWGTCSTSPQARSETVEPQTIQEAVSRIGKMAGEIIAASTPPAPASDARPGERLVAAAEEALAIARGEKEPAAVHHIRVEPASELVERALNTWSPYECTERANLALELAAALKQQAGERDAFAWWNQRHREQRDAALAQLSEAQATIERAREQVELAITWPERQDEPFTDILERIRSALSDRSE